MPRKREAPPQLNATEQRFLEALERIKAGKPTDPGLRKLAALGRLNVNISVVAQEADQSRTLIGHKGCKYPRVRAAVLEAMAPVVEPRTAAEVINRKRDEVAALRAALKLSNSVNALLVARLAKVAADCERAIRRADREAASATTNPNHIAGRGVASPNIDAANVYSWPPKGPKDRG